MQTQKHYLVVGLGITGLSVVEYLTAQGVQVTVTDSSASPSKLLELTTRFPQVTTHLGKIIVPETTDIIVVSPGVPLTEPALKNAAAKGISIIGDIELFARAVNKPVLAITGSNGKSTVTTLLAAMAVASDLKVGVGGNLGTPALTLLAGDHDCYILELSSFQLESLSSLRPSVVTVLNISPDHMDRYADLTAYQQAKLRIYNNAQHAVVNRGDKLTSVPSDSKIDWISFGLDQPTDSNYGIISNENTPWLAKGKVPLMPVSAIAMLGGHNIENALAALAMGQLAGFNLAAMLSTLREFTGLEHRCEKVLSANNIVWVNDSKGTNVAATVAALQGLGRSITGKWLIILGGVGKNADFTPLLEPIKQYCRAAILIGAEQKQLLQLLSAVTTCYTASSLEEAVIIASERSISGDGVLLSPACASFDMFDNYMHRGEVFKQQVLQRIGKQHATTAE